MGKYIKKSKISGDVAVMEVSRPIASSLRTRAAKTLALQRLRSQSPSAAAARVEDRSDSSYLQLRNRRLEKPLVVTENKKLQQVKRCGANPRVSNKSGLAKSESVVASPVSQTWKSEGCDGGANEDPVSGGGLGVTAVCDIDSEASLGENNLEFDILNSRSTRESTPCNILIRDSEPISTPGSSSTQISLAATHRRNHNIPQRITPSTHEIEEFFAYAEQQQQRFFTEKYNFDFVNDVPIAGRYDWVQVVP